MPLEGGVRSVASSPNPAPSTSRGSRAARLVMDEEIAATLGPERAAKFRKLMEARQARQKKTTTAGGAFIASQVNSKEKIGSAAAYTTPEEREGHLGEFLRGAHAFVSSDAYLKIRGEHLTEVNFNAWGAGSNFVAPLSDADKLVEVASRPWWPGPVPARGAASASRSCRG